MDIQPTTTITAAVLTCEGELSLVELTDPLKDLYRLIGCTTVDLVSLDSALDMWLDDMGIGGPVNAYATLVASGFGYTHQPYFGTAVYTGGADRDGNALPIGQDMVHLIKAVLLLAS